MAFNRDTHGGLLVRKLGVVTLGLAIGLVSPAPALARMTDPSLHALADQELRLASVAYRLSHASVGRCAHPNVLTGLVVHDLSEYDAPNRAVVARSFGLGAGIGVLAVVQGSPAQRAGLQRNDEIISVNGQDVQASPATSAARSGSYDRIGGFTAGLAEDLRAGVVQLVVRRQGATVPITLGGELGCGGEVALMPSRSLNAWSDGKYVAVTTKMMSFATDGELAFVVAHEMSHNILGHQELLGNISSGLFSTFGRNASRIKATEAEADRFAIGLMDDAGCDLSAASEFLRRSSRKRWPEIATTHPGTGARIEIVSKAIADRPAHSPALSSSVPQFASIELAPAQLDWNLPTTGRSDAAAVSAGESSLMWDYRLLPAAQPMPANASALAAPPLYTAQAPQPPISWRPRVAITTAPAASPVTLTNYDFSRFSVGATVSSPLHLLMEASTGVRSDRPLSS